MFNTSALKDIDVGVLGELLCHFIFKLLFATSVNNVGMSYEYPNYFTEVSLNVSRDVTVVNTLSVIAVCVVYSTVALTMYFYVAFVDDKTILVENGRTSQWRNHQHFERQSSTSNTTIGSLRCDKGV
jgi:hypothetical protein